MEPVYLQLNDIIGVFYIDSIIVEQLDHAVVHNHVELTAPHDYLAELLRKVYEIDYPDGYATKDDYEDATIAIAINEHHFSFTCMNAVAKAIVVSAAFEPYYHVPLDDEISKVIKRMIPVAVRPPTDKSLAHARKLSVYFGANLPDNAAASSEACFDFIEKYHLRYQCASYYKETKYNAKQVFRWFLAYCYYNEDTPDDCIIAILSLEGQTMLDEFLENIGIWLSYFANTSSGLQRLAISIFKSMLDKQFPELKEDFLKYLPQVCD